MRAPNGREPRPRLILVADSFANWWSPDYWVAQTSDEYIASISALGRVIGGLSNTQLLVRAKHKTDCNLESLVCLVEPPSNCAVKIRDVPFAEDLARADLLVSFRSTTILEALQARKPVLLWGGTSRARYLPAATERPEPGQRSAVYALDDPNLLGPMVEAILDAHANRPLTDDEVLPFIWPPDTPDIGDIAEALACGDFETMLAQGMPEISAPDSGANRSPPL